ncbi:MAG: LpxD N-terminal domain-containing protein, partial [Planctomycetota bacterium]
MSSGAVADQLGAELIGSADIVLSGLEGLEKAQSHDLSFVRDTKHIDALHETKAGAVIISRPVVETLGKTNG